TSRSRDVAYSFAKKGLKRLNIETVMLEIEVNTELLTMAFADIAEYSIYRNEEEILFDLDATFTIKNVSHIDSENIYLVKLIAVPAEIKNDNDRALDYNLKALEIFEKTPSKEHVVPLADTYSEIGDIYYEQSNYAKALEYHLKCLNIQEDNLRFMGGYEGYFDMLRKLMTIYEIKNDASSTGMCSQKLFHSACLY
ncbi:unnamed protein product, partial [Didymodactylos carnosus]